MQELQSQADKDQAQRQMLFARSMLAALAVFIGLLWASLVNAYTLLAIVLVAACYAFLRHRLEYLLALALPALALGQVIHIPLTPTWIYDATLSEALISVAAIVFMLDVFISGRLDKVRADGVVLLLGSYFVLAAASYFRVADLQLYVAGLKVAAYSLLACFLSINLLREARARKIFYAGLSSAVLILSAQIFHTFYQMGFSSRFFFYRSEILIPVGAIALVSAMFVFAVPVILGRAFTAGLPKPEMLLHLAALSAGLLAVFLMLGKGAILALFAGLLYFMRTARKHRVLMILAFMLFAVFSYMLFMPYLEGLFERFQTAVTDTNFEFRKQEYKTGLKIFSANPLYGVGAGQQLLYYQKMIDPYYRQLVNNFLLQAAIDFGCLGLGLVMLLALAMLVKASRAVRLAEADDCMAAGIAAGLLSAAVNGLVEVTFFALPYAVIFWLSLGLLGNPGVPAAGRQGES